MTFKPITLLFIFLLLTMQVVSGQGPVVSEEKLVTYAAYCHLCNDSDIIRLLPLTWKLSNTKHTGDLMISFAYLDEQTGILAVREITADTCPVESKHVFKSKRETLEAAVKVWLGEVKPK